MRRYPSVVYTEQSMREGMQIEDPDIPVDEKVRLLDALSDTGLKRISIGSFVHPKWVPQMAKIDEIASRFKPKPGVMYSALYMGSKGVERYSRFVPPLVPLRRTYSTQCHGCDVFAKRNTNQFQAEEIAGWPAVVAAAVEKGVKTAGIGVNAAFGSNWCGDIPQDFVMELLQSQRDFWSAAGVTVDSIYLGDPMGWNTPDQVEGYIGAVKESWPEIRSWSFHLHNTRGVALASHYAVLTSLGPEDTAYLDGSVGGMAGCPYCGNGRAASMVPTEDFIYMTQEMGIRGGELAGVDLDRVVEASCIAEEVVGHPLWGHVSKAGPKPRGDKLYPMDMPFIMTLEEASHFRRGPSVYSGCTSPWDQPVKSAMRDYAVWRYSRYKPA